MPTGAQSAGRPLRLRLPKPSLSAPDWLFTYAGAILLVGVAVNLGSGFTQYTFSLTLPSMETVLGLSHTEAGFIVTFLALVRIGSTFIAGTLAPRYGSRLIIGLGTICSGGAMILLGFAGNYLTVLLAAGLMGMFTGMALTPMMGLLSPWFRMRDRGLAAGLAATGGSFAFIASGVLVPALIGLDPTDGWRHSWQVFGITVVITGVVALVFLRERPEVDPDRQVQSATGAEKSQSTWPMAAYKNPMVWLLTSLAFTSGWSNGIFTTFFGVYLSQENGISLATVGQLVVLMGVLSVVSGVLWGRMSDRLSRAQAFFYSFLIQGTALALMAVFPGLATFIFASVLIGFTMRAAYTICAASAGDHVPVQFSSAAFGLMSVGAGLGNSISPTIGGVIADNINMNWSFGFATIGTGVGVALSLALYSRTRQRSQPLPVDTASQPSR